MTRRILLTGGSGLIGQYALEPLVALGYEVFAVSRKPDSASSRGVRWLTADLLDSEGRSRVFREARPDLLLHLAWDTRPGIYLESDENFIWVAAGLEMLRLFRKYGGKRVVFAGTCFEYAFADRLLREDGPTAPVSTYAKCKLYLNRLAAVFCGKNGISYGWGRIFYVYGKNEQPGRLTPSVIAAARGGEPLVIKGGSLIRDYMYAGDIAGAFAAFLSSEVEGEVNICTGKGIMLEDYCRALARMAGKEENLRFADQPGNQPPRIVGDAGRLRDEVGFGPRYDLDAGFAEMLADMEAVGT